MRYFRKKRKARVGKRTNFDFNAPGIINVIVKRRPALAVFVEIPTNPGQTQVYELDLSTITANTTYSKITTQAYYIHTLCNKKVDHED